MTERIDVTAPDGEEWVVSREWGWRPRLRKPGELRDNLGWLDPGYIPSDFEALAVAIGIGVALLLLVFLVIPLVILFGEIALVALLFCLLPFWQPWNVVARSQKRTARFREHRWSVRGRGKAKQRLHEVAEALTTGGPLPRHEARGRV